MGIINPSTRRRLRRQRASARKHLWLQKRGLIYLSKQQSGTFLGRLLNHHSSGPYFNKTVAQRHTVRNMANLGDSYPWKCVCLRLNKKTHVRCPMCGAHWTKGQRHYTGEDKEQWTESSEWNYRDGSRSRKSYGGNTPRGGYGGDTPRKGNGTPRQQTKKPKGKKKDSQQSPFQPLHSTPWPSSETTFGASSTTLSSNPFSIPSPAATQVTAQSDAMNVEWVEAAKKSYPDMSTAPDHIRELVEKTEKQNTKNLAKALHRASTKVSQSSKRISELKESQTRHRNAWVVHLKEALTSWEAQMKSYTDQQQTFKDTIAQVQAELQAARQEIHQLNLRAGGTEVPMTSLPETQVVDLTQENSKAIECNSMMAQVQEVLQRCAKAALIIEDKDEDFDNAEAETKDPPAKRPRSVERPEPANMEFGGGGMQSMSS